MPTEVIVALIAFFGVVAGALGGALSNTYIDRRKALLDESNRLADAQREYEYEARKRLYADLQPLLFQLAEACDSALRRFRNLAKTARKGELDLNEKNLLTHPDDESYLLSTMYRLMLPVVLVRLIRRRLTFLDLRLDDRLRQQYLLAQLIHQTWNDGVDVIDVEPPLKYKPRSRTLSADDPSGAETAVQHLATGQLDLIAESMTVTLADGKERAMDFGEFIEAWARRDSEFRSRLDVLADLLRPFRMDRRPVLWRLMICQASIWLGFIRAANHPEREVAVAEFTPAEIAKLDWRKKRSPETAEESDARVRAGMAYAAAEFEKLQARFD